jgi:hypothetical protein
MKYAVSMDIYQEAKSIVQRVHKFKCWHVLLNFQSRTIHQFPLSPKGYDGGHFLPSCQIWQESTFYVPKSENVLSVHSWSIVWKINALNAFSNFQPGNTLISCKISTNCIQQIRSFQVQVYSKRKFSIQSSISEPNQSKTNNKEGFSVGLCWREKHLSPSTGTDTTQIGSKGPSISSSSPDLA